VEKLHPYIAYFNRDFIGVTGSAEEITALTKQLGIGVVRRPGAQGDGYLIDHSASILLVDPMGSLRALFGAPHNPQAIAKDLLAIQREYPG